MLHRKATLYDEPQLQPRICAVLQAFTEAEREREIVVQRTGGVVRNMCLSISPFLNAWWLTNHATSPSLASASRGLKW